MPRQMRAAPGYPLQILSRQMHGFRVFHFYPFRTSREAAAPASYLLPMSHFQIIGIKETCLYVNDLARTRSFYEGVIGLSCFSFVEGNHAFFRAGYSVLLCFDPTASRDQQRLPQHFGSGELHFAFEVERGGIDHWKDLLIGKGIAIEHDHEWPGGFRSIYFRDPDRHCVEIIERGMWEHEAE